MGKKIILILGFIGVAWFMDTLSESYGVMVNQSESLPYWLFFRKKAQLEMIEHGILVSFWHPVSKELVAKEVVGLPGDEIRIQNDRVYVNEMDIGVLQKATSTGIPLKPIEDEMIKEGYVFVRGRHERSFDSRYAEFGLVPIDSIQDMLKVIF